MGAGSQLGMGAVGAASRQGKVVQLQLKSSSNSEKQLSQPWPTTRTCRRSRSWEGQPSNLSAGTGLDGRLSGTCSTTQTLERVCPGPPSPGSGRLSSTASTTPAWPDSGLPACTSSLPRCLRHMTDQDGCRATPSLESTQEWVSALGTQTPG